MEKWTVFLLLNIVSPFGSSVRTNNHWDVTNLFLAGITSNNLVNVANYTKQINIIGIRPNTQGIELQKLSIGLMEGLSNSPRPALGNQLSHLPGELSQCAGPKYEHCRSPVHLQLTA